MCRWIISCAVSVFLSGFTWQIHAKYAEHRMGGLSGIIKSPNYPSTYPENLNISWIIEVKPGFRISLYFTEFDVEDSYDEDLGGACVYDFLEIKEEGRMMHKFCGSKRHLSRDAPRINQQFTSSDNQMSLQFVSDYSNEDPLPVGFVAHYTEIDRDECHELKVEAAQAFEDWDTLLYCNQHCNNVPGSYYCSCDIGFSLHDNQHTCTYDCDGKILRAPEGEIATSHYPGKYSKLAECDWTIQQIEGISVEIKFVGEFRIEEHDDEGCAYDWLEYEDAKGVRSKKYCGTNKPANGEWIRTNSHMVKVIFHSDLTLEYTGFKLQYRTTRIACLITTPQVPQNGQITSPVKDYVLEDIVTFECNKGYRLIGPKQITCQNDGTWSAKDPICQIKRCKPPADLQSAKNGRIKEKSISLTYGSKVTFLCYIWYEMTSGTSVWRCGDDEMWHEDSQPVANNTNRNIPKCEPLCGLKGNKKIRNGSYNFGDVIPNVEDLDEQFTPQIIAGTKSRNAEWPWVVFISLFGHGLDGSDFCGGSLVSSDAVITAAHCTAMTYAGQVTVYVGVTDRASNKMKHVQVFGVAEIIQHEDYGNTSLFENDVAILKLNASVVIGKYARPICLPRSEREQLLPVKALSKEKGYYKTGVIAGWGITELGRSSYDLVHARVPPIEHGKCKRHLDNDDDPYVKVSKNMICGGFLDGSKDSCQGDSGGPYMFKDKAQGRYILNAIVSFGSSAKDCGDKTFGIYTNIAKFMAWIETFVSA